MLRANLYKKNIISNHQNEIIELVLSFNHALVEISQSEIIIKEKNGSIHKYNLELLEKDFATTTYLGKFENGTSFRLIQPYGLSLDLAKKRLASEGAFTLGSMNPDGYAIHFSLTNQDDIRETEIQGLVIDEQIQRLIDMSLTSLQFGLQQKFVEFTKRLLVLIETNPSSLNKFINGQEIAKILFENAEYYSIIEQQIIKKTRT